MTIGQKAANSKPLKENRWGKWQFEYFWVKHILNMEYKIYVGTFIKIKKGFMQGSFKFMYCGMSNEDTFILAPFIAVGYQGFSPNIYYNSNSSIIQIFDKEFEVIEVTSDYIILGD